MKNKINVLMTGAGAPGGPGIIKALLQNPNINLIVCDADANATGRYLGVHFIQIPFAGKDYFIDEILKLCLEYSINVVFPLVTSELFKFSINLHLFHQIGTKVIVSGIESLTIANSKGALLDHLHKSGIIVPQYHIVSNKEDLIIACEKLGYPKNQIVVKPCISNGSRGIRILSETVSEFDLLFNHKPNNLYSNLHKYLSIIGQNKIPQILVSEYLPGDEFTIDTIVKNGRLILVIPRKRVKMVGGISTAGTFIKNENIIKYVEDIVSTLNLNGPIGLQVKSDINGIYKILEINPRIQGTSVAALGIGINLPLISVFNEMNIQFEEKIEIKWGTNFVRYYNEAFF
jgi:carbamoyl-phosphate synthase large subunit